MSIAHECDICGTLFLPAKGCVSIEGIHVTQADGMTSDSWSDFDFCKPCGAKLLDVIRPALNDYEDEIAPVATPKSEPNLASDYVFPVGGPTE